MNDNIFEGPKSPEKKNDEYPKLIRDKIVEIVEKDRGQKPETRTLTVEEFKKYLFKKITEEVEELQEAGDKEHQMEEIGDMLEVIDEIVAVYGLNLEEIRKVQKEKSEKRGGFKKENFDAEEGLDFY